MKRIALIEDNPDNRLLVCALLGDKYSIDEYGTAEDGLDGMKNSIPDIVLMDISLPGMSGHEALAVMRNNDLLKDIPCIALTAHAMSGDREELLGKGFNDYLTKPIIDENILFSTIDDLL